MNESIITLGVDQGIANMGYAVVMMNNTWDKIPKVLESGVLTTEASSSMSERILYLYDQLEALMNRYPQISVIGTESLFVNSFKTGGRNKSASIVATNMVTGALFLLSARKQTVIKQYTPGSVKKYITGAGDASKTSVEDSLANTIKLNAIEIKANHQSDAIAIAWTSAMEVRSMGLEQMKIESTQKKVSKRSKKPRIITTKPFLFHGVELNKEKKRPEHIPYYVSQIGSDTLSQIKTKAIVGRFKSARLMMHTQEDEGVVRVGYEVGKKFQSSSEVIPETTWFSCEYVDIEYKNIHRYFTNLIKKLEKNPKYIQKPQGRIMEILSDESGEHCRLIIAIEVCDK